MCKEKQPCATFMEQRPSFTGINSQLVAKIILQKVAYI